MSEHPPKLSALEAYAANRLSPSGRARLSRHLTRCATCRSALDAVQAYDSLREAAREEPTFELSWDKLSAALDREVPSSAKPNRTGRVVALIVPMLAVAATALIAWIGISGQREEGQRARVERPQSVPAAPVEAALEGWITLVAGNSDIEQDGASVRATVGASVREGAVLHTPHGAELHVALRAGTGIVVGPDSELRVALLRAHAVRLELLRGTVFNRVQKLPSGDRYDVQAESFTADVRGTRFTVEHREGVAVSVQEGRVAVLQSGSELALLEPGQKWESTALAWPSVAKDRDVHGLDEASRAWPTLILPAMANVAAWQLDGAMVAAKDGIAMRAPPGALALQLQDHKGLLHTVTVTVAPEGTTLDESLVAKLLTPRGEASGYLAPEQISPVVRTGLNNLRRCYERSLRRLPTLQGKLTLAMRVAPDGHVARATLQHSTELPAELESCLLNEARTWQFPRPTGGAVAFEVPVNLKAGR